MTKKQKHQTIIVPAVDKMLDIIEYMAAETEGKTLKQLSDALSIPAASTFRLIRNLLDRGYVREYPEGSGRYKIGLRFLHLNSMLLNQMDIVLLAKPIMKDLALITGQTAQLGVLQGYEVTYLMQEMPNMPLNLMAYQHLSLPVNVSAAGKVLVAFLGDDQKKEFIKNCKLPKQVKNTITDKVKFETELQKVRKQEFAFDDEEYGEGIGCLSAPVFDHTGNCIAAIGITGQYLFYKNKEKRNELLEKVKKAAAELSKELGYNIK